MRWRRWLRHCATSRKVAGSILDGVIGIFHWHNPSDRTMSLGWTQPVTEVSTRNISWGSKGGRCVELTTLPPSGAKCLEIWKPQPPGIVSPFITSFPQLRNWPIARSVPRSHAALHKTQISELADTYPHTAACWCILKVRILSKVEICKGASLPQSAQAGVKLQVTISTRNWWHVTAVTDTPRAILCPTADKLKSLGSDLGLYIVFDKFSVITHLAKSRKIEMFAWAVLAYIYGCVIFLC
jgi:hypothetical protein